MKVRILFFLLHVFICILGAFPTLSLAKNNQETTPIFVATGSLTGSYNTTGRSICRLVNKERAQFHVRCEETQTHGALFNINALIHGETEFALIQSDLQYYAVSGQIDEEQVSVGTDKIRALFSIYNEPFTIIVKEASNVQHFSDLKHKRLNIGTVCCGQRHTFERFVKHMGWQLTDFEKLTEYTANKQASALCNGEVDALIVMAGHPNHSVEAAVSRCNIRFVSIRESVIDSFVAQHPYYIKMMVMPNVYGLEGIGMMTFGVRSTLVTTKDVSEETVYAVVHSVFENINYFRRFHPLLATLDEMDMLKSNTAPYSPGALRYFQERGWVTFPTALNAK